MKRLSLLMLIALFVSAVGYSQNNLIFHENFEPPSQADSVNSSGPTGWNVGNTLASQGTYSDSASVVLSDTNKLITNSMDLSSYSNVRLSFDHICKVAIVVNKAEIYVSTDDGATWSKLTDNEYEGNSNTFSNYNSFDENAYSSLWENGSAVAPDNSWWKNETFDLSGIAGNKSNVKIKFSLANISGSTSAQNYGWFIDDIRVHAANSEMIPPQISMVKPFPKDTSYLKGPFNIKAEITDNTGIDTANIHYQINGGSMNTVGMNVSNGNTYVGTVPAGNYSDTYSYYLEAIDASSVQNSTRKPVNSTYDFEIVQSPAPSGCNNPVTSFPVFDNFDNMPKASSTSCGDVHILSSTFTNLGNDSIDWIPYRGATVSGSTGPTGDHTTDSTTYLYLESSNGCENKTAILESPCVDLTNLNFPVLKFWYNMRGDNNMGDLEVQVYFGGQWKQIWKKSGDQGSGWHNANIALSDYKVVTKLRIVGTTGTDYNSDIAIDDVTIGQPPAEDAGIFAVQKPKGTTQGINQDIILGLKNYGSSDMTNVDIKYSINGQTPSTYSWTGLLKPGNQIDSLNIGAQTFNTGNTSIKAWTSNPNGGTDTINYNDTASASAYMCDGYYSGAYTVDSSSSADFVSINDALSGIQICGMNDDVILNLEPGNYDKLEIDNFNIANKNARLIIQSASGNPADVRFEGGNGTSSTNYVVRLAATSFVTFKDVTIESNGTTYGRAVELEQGASYNRFENCVIKTSATSSSSNNMAVVYSGDGTTHQNVFKNNTIENGSYGVLLEESSYWGSARMRGIKLIDNTIRNFNQYGISLADHDSVKVIGNTIESLNGSTSMYGIDTDDCFAATIAGNRIHLNANTSSTINGIYLDGNGSNVHPFEVYNNMLSIQGATGTVFGIHMHYTDTVRLVYNSINVASGSNSHGRGVYLNSNSSSPNEGNVIMNNIIANTGGGVAIEFDSDAYNGSFAKTVDYNDLYASGTNLVRYGGQTKQTLSAWVSASGFDANSVSANPGFEAVDSLYAGNPTLNGAANPLSYVSIDIDSNARDNANPDIGAVEFNPPFNDLAVKEMVSPVSVCSGNSADVKVKVSNVGLNTVNSATIDWSINGTSQSTLSFGGTLAPGADTIMTLGQHTFNYGNNYNIKVWSSAPNGNPDDNNLNDTLLVQDFGTGLPAGTYTVGGTSADFNTLSDAAVYLNNYGICGAVTIDVTAGTYNEQIEIREINGASSTNTITLKGATGDSSDVVVEYNGNDPSKNYVIYFNGSDYLTLKNMTLKNTSKDIGRVITFEKGASHLEFVNNHLEGKDTADTDDDFALIYSKESTSQKDTNITIANNYIKDGSYGIYFEGVGGNELSPNTKILGNKVIHQYETGIYLENHDAAQVKNNYVYSAKDHNFYEGILLNDVNNQVVVTGNKVVSEKGAIAIHLDYCESTSGNEILVANNFIYAAGKGTNYTNGALNIDNTDFVDVVYNSIKYEGSDATRPAMLINNAESVTLKNNNVSNFGGGIAMEVSYYSTNPISTADYNNYYTTGSTLIDNDGTQVSSISQWQVTGNGTNSISANPHFYGKTDLHSGSSALNNAGTPVSAVTTDIDGEPRDANNPDIGADEFTPTGYNLAVTDVITPITGCELTSNETVTIEIANPGVNNVSSNLNASYKVAGSQNIVTETVSQSINSGDTITFTFNSKADLSVNSDSTFEIISWTDYSQDLIQGNDTAFATIINKEKPADPAISDISIPWQSSGELVSNSSYTTYWYDSINATTPIHFGDTLKTPVLYDTTTYYVEDLNGTPDLKITELQLSTYGDGVTPNMPSYVQNGDDIFEITNMGTAPVDMGGYQFIVYEDSYTGLESETYTLPAIVVKPGKTLLLDVDAGNNDFVNNYLCMDFQTISYMGTYSDYGFILQDNSNNYVDVVSYGSFDMAANTNVPSGEWSSSDGQGSSSGAGIIRVNSDNNDKSDWVESGDPQPVQTIGSVNPQLQNQVGGLSCYSNRVPVNVNVIDIPTNNAELTNVDIISSGCGLTNEPASIDIRNFGYDSINGNMTANYQIIGASNVISESVTTAIAPNDTLTYNFNTPVDLNSNQDSLFEIKFWVDLANDTLNQKDTMTVSVFNGSLLTAPVAADMDVTYGNSATLNASSNYGVYWYEDAAASNLLNKGYSFKTPTLYDTTTYYIQANEQAIDTISTTMGGAKQKNGIMFNLNANQQVFVDSFAVNMDTLAAPDIQVYYRKGGYQGYETDSTAWKYLGTDQLTAKPNWGQAVTIKPGVLKIKAGVTYGIYITTKTDSLDLRMSNGAVNKTDNKLTINSGAGVDYPFTNKTSNYGFNGAVYYSNPVGCPSNIVSVNANVINPPAADAGIDSVVSPYGSVPIGANTDIKVLIHNYGTDTLNSVDVKWSVDGGNTQTYNWTGSIEPASISQPVTVSTANLSYGDHDLKIWTEGPNSSTDNYPANDTATSFFNSCIDSGVYTIGPANGDFADFNSAVAALNYCGIQGPVTFDVEAGTYEEQIELTAISGSNAKDTITFRSASGNPADVSLEFADTSSTTDNYVVMFNNTGHFRFMDMTLEAKGSSDAKVVFFDNHNRDIKFVNNTIQGITSNSSYQSERTLVDSDYSQDTSIYFMGNTLNNGFDGIEHGDYDNDFDIRIVSNTFNEQFNSAITVDGADSLVVKNNYTYATNSDDEYNGIYLEDINSPAEIRSNEIISLSSDKAFTMDDVNGSTGKHVLVANNSVINKSTGSYGNRTAYVTDCSFIDFYFNTFRNRSQNSTSSEAMYISSCDDIVLKNNIFANDGNGYSISVSSSTTYSSDYNDLYTAKGQYLAEKGYSDIDDLNMWQQTTLGDMNSVSADPLFASPEDNHVASISLFGAGTAISGITTDIDGDSRHVVPAIGADEFTPPANDAGLVAVNGPLSPVSAGNNDVYVSIRNFGGDTLQSATIDWSVNGVAQPTYNYTGNLPTADIQDSLMIGTYNFASGPAVIKAWTSAPNGQTDAMHSNDTTQRSVVTCSGALSGNYTIGGTSSDYANFSQAVQALKYCGVSGPVTFDVQAGTYNEQFVIDSIPGASMNDTVVFSSQSGVNTDVVVSYAGAKDANYVVKLQNAEYLTFKDLTLKNTGVDYTRVLVLKEKSNYNNFVNNRIIGQQVNDDDDKYATVFMGPDHNNEFNTFTSNEVKDGSFSFSLEGVSSSNPASGNIFLSNHMSGGYDYAFNAEYQDSLFLNDNHIEVSDKGSYSYALELDDVYEGTEVRRNYILVQGSNSTRGIYLNGVEGKAGDHVKIINNMIVQSKGSGNARGIYMNNSEYVDIYYNTVSINAGTAGNYTAAFYCYGSSSDPANNLNVANNNFANMNQGWAMKIEDDVVSAAALDTFDHNNLYTTGTALGEYNGVTINDLSAMQTQSGTNNNSVSVNPMFVSNTDLHVNAALLNARAMPIAGITQDYDGDVRDATQPDIGADEFDPIPVDLSVIEITKPDKSFAPVGFIADVEAIVKNLGADTIYNYDLKYEYAGQNPVIQTVNDTIFPGYVDTVQFNNPISTSSGNNVLSVYTDISADGDTSNDTLNVEYLGLSTFTPNWSNNCDGPVHFAHEGNNDIWERGMPQGNNIQTTHSGMNAWMTDLDADYPSNVDAYLYTPLYDLSGLKDVTLEFWHNVDVDPGKDGVAVEYSIDGGVSWHTLTDTASGATSTNWYNDTIGYLPMWSGQTGWMKSSVKLSQFDYYPTPIQFRFYIYSSSTATGDGWAIDDFALKRPVYGQDAGVVQINQPKDSTITGDLVNVEVQLKNLGVDTLTSFPVSYDVNGNVETETWNGTLYPDSVTTFAFSAAYNSPSTDYELQAYTELSTDENLSNDTAKSQIVVTKAPVDAGVTEILLPNDTTTQFESTKVRVRIFNYGTDTLTSIPVSYDVSGQVENETWSGTLTAGDSVDYTFNAEYTSTAGSYQICAKTDVSGDYDNSNDEVCKSIVATNINEHTIFGDITIRPNPANQYAIVDFDDQLTGKLILTVTNVMGKTIKQESYMLNGTDQSARIETRNYPAGIYFVNLENSKGKTTLKLIVKH